MRQLGKTLGLQLGSFLGVSMNTKSGIPTPPFSFDLARYLKYDGTINIIDQIGDETRPMQPDRCITGDGVNTITFPTVINGIKYYDKGFVLSAAIDVSATHIWTIASVDVCGIKLYSDTLCTTEVGYLTMQEKSGVALFDNSGNDNHATLSDESVRDTTIYPEQLRNSSNKYGWNKAAYFNGTGYITLDEEVKIEDGDSLTLWVNPNELAIGTPQCFISNVKTTPTRLSYLGFNNVDKKSLAIAYIWEDESGFDSGGIRFSTDFKPVFVKLTISIVGNTIQITRHDTGETVIRNIAKAAYMSIKTLGYYNSSNRLIGYLADIKKNGLLIDPLNGSTIGTPTNVDFNKIVIPNDLANNGFDVFGRESLYKGLAKMNAEVVGGYVGVFNGSALLTLLSTLNLGTSHFIEYYFMPTENTAPAYTHFAESTAANNYIYTTSSNLAIAYAIGSVNTLWSFTFVNNTRYKIRFVRTNTSIELFINNISQGIKTLPNNNAFTFNQIGRRITAFPLKGTLDSINLNNQAIYDLNNHLINRVTGILATNNGVTFQNVTDYTPQSTIDSLSKTVYKDASGNLIIDPQYPATTETVIKGKGYKGIGNINYDPIVWETYKSYLTIVLGVKVSNGFVNNGDRTYTYTTNASSSYLYNSGGLTLSKPYRFTYYILENPNNTIFAPTSASFYPFTPSSEVGQHIYEYRATQTVNALYLLVLSNSASGLKIGNIHIQEITEHKDSPNRSGNLVVNGDMVLSTGGIADGITKKNDIGVGIYSIVTGNGFTGNAQRVESTVDGLIWIGFNMPNLIGGETYIIRCKYRVSNTRSYFIFAESGSITPNLTTNTGDAKGYQVEYTSDGSGNSISLLLNGMLAGDWFEVSDVEVHKLEATTQVGYMPHAIYFSTAFENNPQGDKPYYIEEAKYYANWNNPAERTPEMCTPEFYKTYLLPEYHFILYKLIKGESVTEELIYTTKKTETEQLKLSKYQPTYE